MTPRTMLVHEEERTLRLLRLKALFRWLALSGMAVLLAFFTLTVRADDTPGRQLGVINQLSEQGWAPVGEGALRWLGFSIYRAALWAPQDGNWLESMEFALVLRYQRDISGQRLVRTSLDEMRRLGVQDETLLRSWRAVLEQAFPDVLAGDMIVGLVRPGEGVKFYHGDQLKAHIDDPFFAQAFFGIWLDERTREPSLRAQLIGLDQDG